MFKISTVHINVSNRLNRLNNKLHKSCKFSTSITSNPLSILNRDIFIYDPSFSLVSWDLAHKKGGIIFFEFSLFLFRGLVVVFYIVFICLIFYFPLFYLFFCCIYVNVAAAIIVSLLPFHFSYFIVFVLLDFIAAYYLLFIIFAFFHFFSIFYFIFFIIIFHFFMQGSLQSTLSQVTL